MGPNFFLVGAAKSGTTSIADYLDLHPEAFVCDPKEPNFFAYPMGAPPTCRGPLSDEQLYEILLSYSTTDPAHYQQLFADSSAYAIRCDASVRYLYFPDAANRIHDHAPNAKIAAILRDPVDRLNSHYHMNIKLGVEKESLHTALRREPERIADGWGWDWHYVQVGRYASQIARYDELFGRHQVHIMIYEDFVRDSAGELRRLFEFLGIAPDFAVDTNERSNVGRTPKLRLLHNLLRHQNPVKSVASRLIPRGLRQPIARWVDAKNQGRVPKIDDQLRKELRDQFADDRRWLESRLQRTLPW